MKKNINKFITIILTSLVTMAIVLTAVILTNKAPVFTLENQYKVPEVSGWTYTLNYNGPSLWHVNKDLKEAVFQSLDNPDVECFANLHFDTSTVKQGVLIQSLQSSFVTSPDGRYVAYSTILPNYATSGVYIFDVYANSIIGPIVFPSPDSGPNTWYVNNMEWTNDNNLIFSTFANNSCRRDVQQIICFDPSKQSVAWTFVFKSSYNYSYLPEGSAGCNILGIDDKYVYANFYKRGFIFNGKTYSIENVFAKIDIKTGQKVLMTDPKMTEGLNYEGVNPMFAHIQTSSIPSKDIFVVINEATMKSDGSKIANTAVYYGLFNKDTLEYKKLVNLNRTLFPESVAYKDIALMFDTMDTSSGNITAWNKNGRMLWTKNLRSQTNNKLLNGSYIYNDTIFCSFDGLVYAYDIYTGEELAEFKLPGDIKASQPVDAGANGVWVIGSLSTKDPNSYYFYKLSFKHPTTFALYVLRLRRLLKL